MTHAPTSAAGPTKPPLRLFRPLALVLSLAMPYAAAAPGATTFAEEFAWALNVGGDAMETRAGETFAADDCSRGSAPCGAIDAVHRTQNSAIYRSFRSGDQRYRVPLEPGNYDVVLFFVESSDALGRERRFDVLLEGDAVLEDFSPLIEKGMQSGAAVTRSFASRPVTDGALDIELIGRRGEAVLSAILVRQSQFGIDGWTQVWSDEFDGAALDAGGWTAEAWEARRVNDEDQEYRRDTRNVRVEDGLLVLEAHYEGEEEGARFSSGRIHGAGKRDLLYGRLDVRARVPVGSGVWPAIWLMPEDAFRYATKCGPDYPGWQERGECDAWPNSGEIDLMEHVGNEPNLVHGTVHTRDYYHKLDTQIGEGIVLPDLGSAFHVYSLVWEPHRLAMFVDGQRYFAYFDDGVGSGQWPFDHAFHVILNLAVGGWWGRARGGIDSSAFPQRLEVDYVRIFQPSKTVAGADVAAQ